MASTTTTVTTTIPRRNGSAALLSGSKARLTACILSTYDLRAREPPIYVSIAVNGVSAQSGPPAQRHKDRNSFKFNRDLVSVSSASLPEMYAATAVIALVYANGNRLTAEYPMKQLKIHETVWLILQLAPAKAKTTSTGTTTSSQQQEPVEEDDDVPPTLRLQLTLEGPYRAEIGFLVEAFQGWFQTVDKLQAGFQDKIVHKLPVIPNMDPKYMLLALAPILAVTVVSAPIFIGVVTVTLPVALPVLVVCGGIVAGLLAVLAFVYASTETGRSAVTTIFQPVAHTLLSTAAGQAVIYQTGPRPTPVNLCKSILPVSIWGRLITSLFIDLIGSSSYLLPVAGEGFDVAWAPIQTILIMAMYDTVSPGLKYVSFVEEILPFTDIVPSATIGWLIEFGMPLLQPNNDTNTDGIGSSSTGVSTTRGASATTTSDTQKLMQLLLPKGGAASISAR